MMSENPRPPPALMAAEPQLFVSDLDAACAFYTGKLGFRVVFLHGEPPFYGQVRRDGARPPWVPALAGMTRTGEELGRLLSGRSMRRSRPRASGSIGS